MLPNELLDLEILINSPVIHKLYDSHKGRLQKQVNQFIKEQNLIEAHSALAKLNDINRIFELAKIRINELKSKKEER